MSEQNCDSSQPLAAPPCSALPGFEPRITPSSDSEWLRYYQGEAQRLSKKVIATGFENSELRQENKKLLDDIKETARQLELTTREKDAYLDTLNEIADALGLPHGVTREKSICSMIINRIEVIRPDRLNNVPDFY